MEEIVFIINISFYSYLIQGCAVYRVAFVNTCLTFIVFFNKTPTYFVMGYCCLTHLLNIFVIYLVYYIHIYIIHFNGIGKYKNIYKDLLGEKTHLFDK